MSLPPFAPENLGDAIAATLPKLQAAAVSMMRDTCRIERRAGRTMDPDSLEYVETWSLVAEGACRVKPMEAAALTRMAGEVEHVTAPHVVARPIDATRYQEGDRVTITAVDPVVGDPAMVGRVLWVTGDPMRSQATKRELACSEVDPLAEVPDAR